MIRMRRSVIAEYAKSRGYVFPEDAGLSGQGFRLGWYKYAPDVAEKLLVKNGFSKNADGKWLLPDGTPWKIEILTCTALTTDMRRAMPSLPPQQWKKFGIDAEVYPSEARADLLQHRRLRCSGDWPAQEPWGAGPDLYRVLDRWNSAYKKPLGERTQGILALVEP